MGGERIEGGNLPPTNHLTIAATHHPTGKKKTP